MDYTIYVNKFPLDGETEVVASGRKQNEGFVQNYALRLPKDFYKALKSYCDQKDKMESGTRSLKYY